MRLTRNNVTCNDTLGVKLVALKEAQHLLSTLNVSRVSTAASTSSTLLKHSFTTVLP